jgi:glyoxylase I family protein
MSQRLQLRWHSKCGTFSGEMLAIETIHHVSLPVSDLDRAKQFYGRTLGLPETDRPPFTFAGAAFLVGDRTLHLIVPEPGETPTFRKDKPIDSHDVHFAIRVRSYAAAVAYLESQGFRASDERTPFPSASNPQPMRLNPTGAAGFPQIFIQDPDGNVIEINAARLD